MSSTESANHLVWQGQPGHYEVYYATLSHPETQTGFWIRYTLESPQAGHGEPYAQLWFATFDPNDSTKTFAYNRRFPIDALTTKGGPFQLQIGDAVLRHDGMKGSLASPDHKAEWDLRWQPAERLHLHLPTAVYPRSFADTKVQSPNLNVAAHGSITVDGRRYECVGAPLGQTHLWGRKHAYSWAWAHCNAFEGDRGVAFEALTVRLRRGPVVTPSLTIFSLYLDGQSPSLIEFREPWQLPFSRSEYGTGRYFLTGQNLTHKVEVEMTCRPEDLILTEYVDPDGEAAFCHNTECASATVKIWKRRGLLGWTEDRVIVSKNMAHYEWGARAGDPLVKKRHVQLR